MSQSTTQHRCESPKSVRCAVVTVSDTRTLETDRGGQAGRRNAGRRRASGDRTKIVRDDPREIEPLLFKLADPAATDAMLITGGTGIAARDQTFETVSGLLTKRCPATANCFAC